MSSTELLTHGSVVRAARFSPDGRRLVTASTDVGSNIKMWDPATGRLLWAASHSDGVGVARWSPDGTTVFTGGFDQWVRRWNAASGVRDHVMLKMLGGVSSLEVSRDGARLVAGTAGGDVRLVTLARDAQPASVMAHQGFVYQTRFSPDGSLVLTSAGDRTARLWDG